MVVALLAMLMLSACSGDEAAGPPTSAPKKGTSRPVEPPPTVENVVDVPPPAWIDTESGSHWLAYSTYCWRSTCVDYVAPGARDDLPTIRVRQGEVIRFHLGFRPRKAVLEFWSNGEAKRRVTLDASHIRWQIERGGVVSLFVRPRPAAGGADVRYVARFDVREQTTSEAGSA